MKSITVRTWTNDWNGARKVTLTTNDDDLKAQVTLLGQLPHLTTIEVTQELINFLQAVLDEATLEDCSPNDGWIFITDSQELESLCDYFPSIDRTQITGALVRINDGDYTDVRITESSRPYSILARYHTVMRS